MSHEQSQPGKSTTRAAWAAAWNGAPLTWWTRVVIGLCGAVLGGLLAVAWSLSPNPTGRGTHQQLGLPPCAFVTLWDIPCPACGMTTSWSFLVHGRFLEACRANVGGVLLAIIGMACVPITWYFCIRGVATRGEWFSLALAILLLIAGAVAMVQWIARLPG